MKVGDTVTGSSRASEWSGYLGTVIGFDEDNDPIIKWNGARGSNEHYPGCGEYRKDVVVVHHTRAEVVDESR